MVGRVNNLSLETSLALKLGKISEAGMLLNRLNTIHPDNDINSNILMTKIQYYAATRQPKEYRQCVDQYFELLPELLSDPVRTPQANEMCVYFMKINQLEDVKRTLDILKETIEEQNQPAHKIIYLVNKIVYEEKIGSLAERDADILEMYSLVHEREKMKLLEQAEQVIFRVKMDEMARQHQQMHEDNQRLQKLAETDNLTQIPNRRAYVLRAEQELEHAVETKTSFALEIMDLDCFKELNDRYGHLAGDHALMAVGQILQDFANESEGKIFVSRYGGDEFCLLYMGCAKAEVEAMAQASGRRVIERNIPNVGSKVRECLTVSQGICFGFPAADTQIYAMMHTADKALYQVKQNAKGSVRLTEKV